MSIWLQIDAFLSNDIVRIESHTEADWHSFWHERRLGCLAPVEMALRGGFSAHCLPQVFISGYQAALHHVFPDLPETGWAAFVAAEDQKEPERFPGTVLSSEAGQLTLSGHKSWVGQSRHVQHLRVTAKQADAVKVVALDAATPGVVLSHRESPRFLAGLSQGFAHFESASVAQICDGFDPRSFGRAEPQFIMLAAAAFLAANAESHSARDKAISLAAALARYCEDQVYAPKTFAVLDRTLTESADAQSGQSIPDWETDKGLLSMYSPRIQKRA